MSDGAAERNIQWLRDYMPSALDPHFGELRNVTDLTDAIDEEDEDAFDETFDDGADLPVSAANEPEPPDPLLGPDAEAAGEDKDA